MGDKIRFAVVGFGRIGKRHANIIHYHPDCTLVAVVDTNTSELDTAQHQYPGLKIFSNIKELEKIKNEIDVISICTPNYLHASLAISALNMGFHVVIEKPMALTKAQSEHIVHKALNAGRNVFVVKQNRYSPPAKWLKQVVEEDKLGKINMVLINCLWNRSKAYYEHSDWKGQLEKDGGILFTQFSHFIDVMYWIFGDIDNVDGRFWNFNHQGLTEFEDSGYVSFDFVKGGKGSISFTTSCFEQNMESSMTVIGEKGSLKIGGQYMDTVEYCQIKDYDMPELLPSEPPNEYGQYKGSAAAHHFVFQNVVNTFRKKEDIATNAVDGMKVVEIIEKLYAKRDLK